MNDEKYPPTNYPEAECDRCGHIKLWHCFNEKSDLDDPTVNRENQYLWMDGTECNDGYCPCKDFIPKFGLLVKNAIEEKELYVFTRR